MKPKHIWFFVYTTLIVALSTVCSPSDLSVSVPSSKSATAGTPVDYTMYVVNNGLAGDTFTVDVSSLPPGFSGAVYPTSFSLEPGMSQSVSVFVTSPVGMPAGNYQFGLSVVSALSGASSYSITYSVTASAGMGATTTTTMAPDDCTAYCINPPTPHWWYGGRPNRRVGSMFNTTLGRLYPLWGQCFPHNRFYSSSPWPVGLLFDNSIIEYGQLPNAGFTPCNQPNNPRFCGCSYIATCDRQCFYFKPQSHTGACRSTCQPCESELSEWGYYGCAPGTSGRCCCELDSQPTLEVNLTTAYHIKYPAAESEPLLCDNLVCKADLKMPVGLNYQVLKYELNWGDIPVSFGTAGCDLISSDGSFNYYTCYSPEWSVLPHDYISPGDSFSCTMSLYLGPPSGQPPCLERENSLTIKPCPESKEDIRCIAPLCHSNVSIKEKDFIEVCHRDIIKWLCRELNLANDYNLRELVFVDHKLDSAALAINEGMDRMPYGNNELGNQCYQNTKAHHLANGVPGVCRHAAGFFISAIKTLGGSAHELGFCGMRAPQWCHGVAMYKSDDGSYWVIDQGLTAMSKEDWSQRTDANCINTNLRCESDGDDEGYCPNIIPCTQTCCIYDSALSEKWYLYPSNTCVPWDPPKYCENAPTILYDCTGGDGIYPGGPNPDCGCPSGGDCVYECSTTDGDCHPTEENCVSSSSSIASSSSQASSSAFSSYFSEMSSVVSSFISSSASTTSITAPSDDVPVPG